MWDVLARGWENFLARPEGPFSLRFVIQPVVAVGIAVRAGLRDARQGRPPWANCSPPLPSWRSFRMHWCEGPLPVSPY